MGEGADHGVGGVEHVAELVAGGLAEDDVRQVAAQAVVVGQPAQHLGGGVLDALVERAGVAEGGDAGRCPGARPADGAALEQLDAEHHVGGDFDAGTDDLAVALHGVHVAQREQGAPRSSQLL